MFDYKRAALGKIPCNLCGADNFFVLSRRAANGVEARTCLCRNCGLIYINPRMTKNEYDNYYRYFYRGDRRSAKEGNLKRDHGAEAKSNFDEARKFGWNLAFKLGSFFAPGLTIDVGSSTGGVLYGIREKMPSLEILGIEPSGEEAAFAEECGVKTYRGLFENLSASADLAQEVSNILCVRSLNHLLEPKKFFLWSYDKLKTGGHLILYVKNFRHQARRAGFISAGVQIDHPYMFMPEVLKLFVESVGFKIVYLELGERRTKHILLVGQKAASNGTGFFEVSKRRYYWRIRFQFLKPYLKAYYLLFYSQRLAFLRKFFLHDAFNYHPGV